MVMKGVSEIETISVVEAANKLNISRPLAYRLAKEGRIPVIRLGRRLIVPLGAFNKWLENAGNTIKA